MREETWARARGRVAAHGATLTTRACEEEHICGVVASVARYPGRSLRPQREAVGSLRAAMRGCFGLHGWAPDWALGDWALAGLGVALVVRGAPRCLLAVADAVAAANGAGGTFGAQLACADAKRTRGAVMLWARAPPLAGALPMVHRQVLRACITALGGMRPPRVGRAWRGIPPPGPRIMKRTSTSGWHSGRPDAVVFPHVAPSRNSPGGQRFHLRLPRFRPSGRRARECSSAPGQAHLGRRCRPGPGASLLSAPMAWRGAQSASAPLLRPTSHGPGTPRPQTRSMSPGGVATPLTALRPCPLGRRHWRPSVAR